MATKISHLLPVNKPEAKKIEFIRFLNGFGEWVAVTKVGHTPQAWDNIMLLAKSYTQDEMDLMIGYHDSGQTTLYLGHFNDGIA